MSTEMKLLEERVKEELKAIDVDAQDALLDALMHRIPSSEFVLFINSIH